MGEQQTKTEKPSFPIPEKTRRRTLSKDQRRNLINSILEKSAQNIGDEENKDHKKDIIEVEENQTEEGPQKPILLHKITDRSAVKRAIYSYTEDEAIHRKHMYQSDNDLITKQEEANNNEKVGSIHVYEAKKGIFVYFVKVEPMRKVVTLK